MAVLWCVLLESGCASWKSVAALALGAEVDPSVTGTGCRLLEVFGADAVGSVFRLSGSLELGRVAGVCVEAVTVVVADVVLAVLRTVAVLVLTVGSNVVSSSSVVVQSVVGAAVDVDLCNRH